MKMEYTSIPEVIMHMEATIYLESVIYMMRLHARYPNKS